MCSHVWSWSLKVAVGVQLCLGALLGENPHPQLLEGCHCPSPLVLLNPWHFSAISSTCLFRSLRKAFRALTVFTTLHSTSL